MDLDHITNYRNSKSLLFYITIASISWHDPCCGECCFNENEDLAAAVVYLTTKEAHSRFQRLSVAKLKLQMFVCS